MNNKKFVKTLKNNNEEICWVKEITNITLNGISESGNIINLNEKEPKKETIPYLIYTKKEETNEEKYDLNSEYNAQLKSKILPMIGEKFEHFRNKRIYKVVDCVFNTFFDEYEILYIEFGKTGKYSRPYSSFVEKVIDENGNEIRRFEVAK